MRPIITSSIPVNIVFRQGRLPTKEIDPASGEFVLQLAAMAPAVVKDLGVIKIAGQVSAEAAQKLAAHKGGAVLQGRITVEDGKLVLLDAGLTFLDPKPAQPPPAPSGPTGSGSGP
jgi:hypothetical protein